MELPDGSFPRALLTGVKAVDLKVVRLWYQARGVELSGEDLEAVLGAVMPGPAAHPLAESTLGSALASSHRSSELFADLGRAAFKSVAYEPLAGAVREETPGDTSGSGGNGTGPVGAATWSAAPLLPP